MIKIKSISMKNFMSIGAVSQGISLDGSDLILVLGENLDLGGNDAKNGTGKSTIVNAISYALYGNAITNIKKDNLINKINGKNMMVTVDFSISGTDYRIERGRRPNIFKFIENGKITDEGTGEDESLGDSRDTQDVVTRTLGMSHEMFKNIISLSALTEPFLSQRANDQRELIEELLGITKLSEKAEKLKEQLRIIKEAIRDEETEIKAIQTANDRIQTNIKSLETRSRLWESTKSKNIETLQSSLSTMLGLDITYEISAHQHNAIVFKEEIAYRDIKNQILAVERELKIYTKNMNTAVDKMDLTSDAPTCPTCNQEMDNDTHSKVHSEFQQMAEEAAVKVQEKQETIDSLHKMLQNTIVQSKKEVYFNTIDDAYSYKTTMDSMASAMESEMNTVNTYDDQIESLRTDGIKEIDYATINEYISLRDHQEFLLKLLTNKDSFIRKKIIDQNIRYLNDRLTAYLEKLGLPHRVIFKSDLEVEITDLGRDYDFGNLSRGEKTRVILAMAWAFRDVFESLNEKINTMFIDELLDNGLDTVGVESTLGSLKQMTRDSKRNIFLISHREELVGRVTNVLKVTKENGFTSFEMTDTNTI